MEILVLCHSLFEGLGSIERWCVSRGCRFRYLNIFSGDILAHESSFDAVIIMGGRKAYYNWSLALIY
jgi:hypothetical protein